jgi:selenocysteine lyase/cysteine desulfurase
MADEEKLAAVRAALPSLGAGIQLNTGSVGPLPAEAAAAMAELAAYERDIGRADAGYQAEFVQRIDEARAGVAAVIGADIDEIALTHGTTDGMNLGSWAVPWDRGAIAVTTTHEHAAGLGSLYALRDRLGVDLRFAEFDGAASEADVVAAFDRAIVPGTRLVSCSHVLWTTGMTLPVERIAALAHERGAVVIVDGAQAVGAIPVRVSELGVEMYSLAAQKWLLGPEGMGALWVRRDFLARALPTFGGHFAWASYDSRGTYRPFDDARRFQVSPYHRPGVVGMARAIGWLTMFVGLEFVHRRGMAMARRAADRLAEIPGVTVLTPRDRMATLVSFRIAGWPAQAALAELAARTFAIARTVPLVDALRISIGFWTTDEELERFLAGVRELAAHTPATLPPRRTLAMLEGRP